MTEFLLAVGILLVAWFVGWFARAMLGLFLLRRRIAALDRAAKKHWSNSSITAVKAGHRGEEKITLVLDRPGRGGKKKTPALKARE